MLFILKCCINLHTRKWSNLHGLSPKSWYEKLADTIGANVDIATITQLDHNGGKYSLFKYIWFHYQNILIHVDETNFLQNDTLIKPLNCQF